MMYTMPMGRAGRGSTHRIPAPSPKALFGVQLNDQVLGDLVIDIVNGPASHNFCLKSAGSLLHPLRNRFLPSSLHEGLELRGAAGLLTHGNHIARLYLIGRDVHALAVYP